MSDPQSTDPNEVASVPGPEQRCLWRFQWDCGRHGNLTSVFVATRSKVESYLGKALSFGEVLGKHSRIAGTLDQEDLTLLTDDATFIDRAIECGLVPQGHNPIYVIEHQEEYE